MAAQALPIGQASSRRFFPGEAVVTCGVDALVQQGQLNPMPYLHRHLNGDWGDLDDYDKRQNDAALESGEDRLFSSYQVTPGLLSFLPVAPGLHFGLSPNGIAASTTLLLPSEY